LAALAACAGHAEFAPSGPRPLPDHETVLIGSVRELRRMVPPEAYLRSYLMWFGGLAPKQIEEHPHGLFDTWAEYLSALGLPDYRRDQPRQDQTNTLMVTTKGRLAESLCIRAAEHDLHARIPIAERIVFKFELGAPLDLASFTTRLDILHRTFLGYPVRLAPADRSSRFYELYRSIARRHDGETRPLTADEVAWAGICTALVEHPEATLY
jgi:hypothetical protein